MGVGRTYDTNGNVINDTYSAYSQNSFNFAQGGNNTGLGDAAPSAPAIADFFGVPVQWVLIAGLGLFLIAFFHKNSRR